MHQNYFDKNKLQERLAMRKRILFQLIQTLKFGFQ